MIANKIQKRKKNIKKFLIFGILGSLILALVFFLSLANWKLYKKRAQLKTQIDSITNEIENVKANIQVLKSNIAKVQTQEYLERIARERLNLKKRGEEVVAVIVSENSSEKENKSSNEQKSWWKVLLEKLFKIRN